MKTVHLCSQRGLWLGPLASEAALDELPALSPAAVTWEQGFFMGLRSQGLDLTTVSHRPEPLWPRGRLFPGAAVPNDVPFETRVVRHTNAPGYRSRSLASGYVREAVQLSREKALAFVATFNPLPWHVAATAEVQKRCGVPWLSFLLDDVLHDPALDRYARVTRSADGHVVVSALAFDRIAALLPEAARLHLDGGVTRWQGGDEGRSMGGPGRHVIYSGAHTEEAGLPLLLAAISLIQLRDVTFTITGDRGHHAGLARLVAADPRVRTTGHLSEAALDELCLSASAFVNPRPPGHAASIASFPSKLMRYLAFGKPVASTWTPGLAEAYRPLLVVADDASPQSLATAITQAVTMSEAERQGLRERIRAFLIPGRLWTTQASRFAAFADAVAASPRRVA